MAPSIMTSAITPIPNVMPTESAAYQRPEGNFVIDQVDLSPEARRVAEAQEAQMLPVEEAEDSPPAAQDSARNEPLLPEEPELDFSDPDTAEEDGADGADGEDGADAEGPEEDASGTESDAPKVPGEMSRSEQQLLNRLRARDAEVRSHEAAHVAASGGLAGAPTFTYEVGPDGQRYAIGGEVRIRSPMTTDPQQALINAERMRAAALAPAVPSNQDHIVAARAMSRAAQAREALAAERTEQAQERANRNIAEGDGFQGEVSAEAMQSTDPVPPARMGGPTAFGPAEHLHSSDCGYCSASIARYRYNL